MFVLAEVPTQVNDLVQAAINVLPLAITLLATLGVGARIAVWFLERWNEFKVTQPEYIQALLEAAATFGADFAEKVGPQLEVYGKEKLKLAEEAGERWLASQGYVVELALLREAIEGVLFRNPDKYPSEGNAEG